MCQSIWDMRVHITQNQDDNNCLTVDAVFDRNRLSGTTIVFLRDVWTKMIRWHKQ